LANVTLVHAVITQGLWCATAFAGQRGPNSIEACGICFEVTLSDPRRHDFQLGRDFSIFAKQISDPDL
jgi:hypothetical protein